VTIAIDPSMRRRIVIASTIGNALEWFDFTVFGLFVGIIGRLYFPSGDPSTSILLAFATFGIAFVARPIGGIVLAGYADRHGRKHALILMIMMMAVGTGLMGVLPTYSAIGIVAPIMVLVARLIQGFSAGGEFGSASALLIEFATPGRRGYYGSWQFVSQALAFALAAGFAYGLNTQLSIASFESWGWRAPFLAGVLIGPIGVYLRRRCDESPEFREFLAENAGKRNTPLRDVVAQYPRELAVAFCIIAVGTAITYVGSIFLPSFAATELKLNVADAQLGLVAANIGAAIIIPFSGALSDRIGRRNLMAATLVVYCVLFYVLLSRLVAEPSRTALWQLQSLGLLFGLLIGPAPAIMTEIFPVGMRSTGASLMYNFAVMLFGGLAPFINSWLVRATGDKLAPVYYIFFAAAVGLTGLALYRERAGGPAAVARPAVDGRLSA
jgi:MHS family proline/betaine transporter-like MFS transporter